LALIFLLRLPLVLVVYKRVARNIHQVDSARFEVSTSGYSIIKQQFYTNQPNMITLILM